MSDRHCMQPVLLQGQGLSYAIDGRMLFQGLDICVCAGEILHVVGENGAGKTTLLKALLGLLILDRGCVLWQGQPLVRHYDDFLASTLFVGHTPGIRKSLTVRENLCFLASLECDDLCEQIDEALAKVGLYGYEDSLCAYLSAGQCRRVALARLYLTRSRLWILDEPYTALDSAAIKALEARFIQHSEGGGAVIFTSHQTPKMAGLKTLSLEV